MPTKCTGAKQLIKIQNECVYQTIAYQADFYFDNKTFKPFKLALDLRTPWSWLKSPVCRTFTRAGEEKNQNCNYYQDNNSKWYNQTYECQSNYCKKVQSRCGEIDYIQEGLSVIGQFVTTQIYFKDKNFGKKPIKNWQILWAHGLSGQSDLDADGVLGLGLQHVQDKDMDEEDYEKEEEDPQIYFEQFTDLWGAINSVYKKIKAETFALYLAEHNSLKKTLLIGEKVVNITDYIHLPESFQLSYTPVPDLEFSSPEEYARVYFQWKVPLRQIVFSFDPIQKMEQMIKEVLNKQFQGIIIGQKQNYNKKLNQVYKHRL
ncbi:hypothetical protein IMG5_183910 [Ichthyophthirius multifiliis]|uniref:Uncharacterized protein n=1 Tax=Ichthyophthirius multifiliis TaxID=5932 RepID=G0R393_ICHMU|nr:hypothetical protein IMG5_183910 [Ichthyophthirius multifiliis]EGR28067.1 hypothetical protein IMG5_183910 [Ichthyophthirius multifiliis]|eukprot:XP_004027412.1 hypothetical protein IMG5_183910 [Ichthyophthirius multifiliis]